MGVGEMSFADLGWGSSDGALLAKALRLCERLRTLDVSLNAIDGDGAKALAAAVLASRSLESFCGLWLQELRDALRDGDLTELRLSDKHLGVPGAMVLADLLAANSSLSYLDLS